MFHFLHTFHPSPVLAIIGPFYIRWYGVFLALGAILGYVLALRLARRTSLSADDVTNDYATTLFFGFLGGRLYHVLNEPSYYWHHPQEILSVWHGGLAIHGALIAGVLTLFVISRRRGLPLLQLTDLYAPAVLLGQAIGRWGNYFNQELFGGPTNQPWGIPIDPSNRPAAAAASSYFHPTFLYESLWDFATLGLLLFLLRKQRRTGMITLLYIGISSLGRCSTEFLRIDRTPHLFGIRLPLLVSGALVAFAAAGLFLLFRRHDTAHH